MFRRYLAVANAAFVPHASGVCSRYGADDGAGQRVEGQQHHCRQRDDADSGGCRALLPRADEADEGGGREAPSALDAILITHEHQDHVQGMAVTARKLGIPVYLTEPTHRAWVRWMTPQKRITYAQWLEQRRVQSAELRAQSSAAAQEAGDRRQEPPPGAEDGNQKTESVRCSADVASEPDDE